jgi:dolichol-phosphate mannosyltransferase
VGAAADQAGQPVSAPLTVIVPVYNEGKNFREWWAQAAPHLPAGARVRVVYDFEEDDTLPVVRELAAQGAPIEPLRNAKKGVLGALTTGLRSVEEGAVLVSMADLSDDFAIIPKMVEAHAAGAAVVVASRYMKGGKQIGGGLVKAGLSRLGGLTLKWVAGFPAHDATNNFRLYDARLLRAIDFESEGGFELAFEITLKAWMRRERVVEVPATWRDRVHGESRFNFRKWLPKYARLWAKAMAHGVLHARWI